MPLPHASGAFGDLLDPRFQKIYHEQYDQLPDMVPRLFQTPPHNGRDQMSWSGVGSFGDWTAFNGSVNYDSLTQAFDTVMTPVEFASGIQVERKLFDDDQFHIMDQRPRGLATAAQRTRQRHAARIFNNAFSVDTYFYVNSEGVALCSNSHLTNAEGVSTANGFDNLTTAALSATAVASARINMVDFRDDRGNHIDMAPDQLLYPPNLYEEAYEIIASSGKVDSAENARNVHEGKYTGIEWNYLSDSNNWFLMDSGMRQMMLFWVDRVPMEFAYAEDLDTIVAKWRGYKRYANAWIDWRFITGAQVS